VNWRTAGSRGFTISPFLFKTDIIEKNAFLTDSTSLLLDWAQVEAG
jgi:hypothetical protein